MPKRLIYCRTSRDRTQQAMSRKVQQAEVLKVLSARELAVDYQVYEEVQSAKNISNRPVFRHVLETVKRPEVEELWAFSLDRLARNLRDMLFILEHCKTFGVAVRTVKEQSFQNDPIMRDLQINVISALVEYQRESIFEFQKIAYQKKSQQGLWLNGSAPFGYEYHLGKVTVIPEEAQIVKDVFSQYIFTKSGYRKIAKNLNDRGYRYKGRPFQKYHIESILKNIRYTGKVSNRYGIFEGQQAAIISKENYNRASEIRKRKKKESVNTHKKKRSFLMCHCPYCGRKLSKTNRRNATNYYYCSSEQMIGSHQTFYVNVAKLEQEIKQRLIEWVSREDRVSAVSKKVKKKMGIDNDSITNTELRFEKEKNALFDRYISKAINKEEFQQQVAVLNEQVQQYQRLQAESYRVDLQKENILATLKVNLDNLEDDLSWMKIPFKVELTKNKTVQQIYFDSLTIIRGENNNDKQDTTINE